MAVQNGSQGNARPLRRLTDELRVRLHLAHMDAKDAWARIGPRLQQYERKAERATEKAKQGVAAVRRELEKELDDLRGRFKH